jgi:4-hydroxysphinganine ceramide fatty acyl 2-hydroxylase
LVFPPVPAALLATIIYQPFYLINEICGGHLYHARLAFSGAIAAYLVYDMIHYYIHYGSPTNQYFYFMKRYHYNHHFVNHDQGFGISSPLWDEVFNTKIALKKLKYMLKW